eukprot:1132681-Pyramimonas_sp.AAC.3
MEDNDTADSDINSIVLARYLPTGSCSFWHHPRYRWLLSANRLCDDQCWKSSRRIYVPRSEQPTNPRKRPESVQKCPNVSAPRAGNAPWASPPLRGIQPYNPNNVSERAARRRAVSGGKPVPSRRSSAPAPAAVSGGRDPPAKRAAGRAPAWRRC